MTVTYRTAVRQDTKLILGLAGPQRSGKTCSALRLATGLAEGGPIYVIDTESGRAKHYAPTDGEAPRPPDTFAFMHGDLTAPFTSDRYLDALEDAERAGAAVVIVDSMSHEHEGPGGILEQHEAELQRMAGDDWRKRDKVKFTAWIKPKAAHNRFVNRVLQLDAHFIFCFRAKEKIALVPDEKGKIQPVNMGWTPICSDRFQYETAILLTLPLGANGVPDLAAKSTLLQAHHRPFFVEGQQLTEATGEALAAWARGGARAAKQEAVAASDASASPTPPETGVKENAQSAFFARESLKIPLQKTGDGGDDFQKFDNQMRKAIKAAPDAAAVERLQKDNAGTLARYADTMPAAYHRLLDALRQAPEDATADAEQGALV